MPVTPGALVVFIFFYFNPIGHVFKKSQGRVDGVIIHATVYVQSDCLALGKQNHSATRIIIVGMGL